MTLSKNFKRDQKKRGTPESRIAERERKRKADEEAAQKPAKDAAAKRKAAAEKAAKEKAARKKAAEEAAKKKPKTSPTNGSKTAPKPKGEVTPKTAPKPKGEVKKPKSKTPAEIEAEARKKWEDKTRNSPARKSGAFTDDQLWAQQKKHRKWKETNRSSKEARMERRNKRLKKKGIPIPGSKKKKKENKKKLEITK